MRYLDSQKAANIDAAELLEPVMIKNFSYTIPTVGRISIGEKVERNGNSLPARLNRFVITAQHKRDGKWVEHPITDAVAKATNQDKLKLTEIPVCLMFNDPDLSLRERFEAFDDKGRMLCAGDGEKARRMCSGKVETVDCSGPDHCEFARTARCKLMTRLNVQIDVSQTVEASASSDPLSSFILRSSGFNTARTLHCKLQALHGLLDGRLIGVPMILKLRQKSSTQSYQSIFYYADLVPAVPLVEAAKLAKQTALKMEEAGLNQAKFEQQIKKGLENGPFEETLEDLVEYEDYLGDDFRTGSAGEGAGTNDGSPIEGVVGLEDAEQDSDAGLEGLRKLLQKHAA